MLKVKLTLNADDDDVDMYEPTAWYDDEDDAPSYNPFRKIRSRITPSARSTRWDSDNEDFRPEGLARVHSEGELRPIKESDEEEVNERKALPRSQTERLPRRKVVEEKTAGDAKPTKPAPQNEKVDEKVEDIDLEPGIGLSLEKTPHEEERARVQAELSRNQNRGLAQKIQRFLVPWRLKGPDGSNQGLSSTGLIISGTAFLAKPPPVNSRRRTFVTSLRLVEGKPCTASSTGDLLETRSKESTTVRITRELSKLNDLGGLRIVYLQNDEAAMSDLTQDFCRDLPYNTTKFSTASKRFRDWMTRAPALHGTSKKQCFWKIPEADNSHLLRLAFGMDFCDRDNIFSDRSRLIADDPNEDSKDLNQRKRSGISPRLSIYVQLATMKTQLSSTYTTKSTIFIHQTLSENVVLPGLWLQDSSWPQNLALQAAQIKSTDPSVLSLFLTRETLIHIFGGILESWNEHFSSIYERLDAIEQIVYANPSDDSQSSEIWAVYKQVLEGQQLLRLHTSLLEEVQRNIEAAVKDLSRSQGISVKDILGTDPFGPMIHEYKEMGKQIPDDLIKPLDHLIDLVYKSVSIRDAKQSLEVNLSLFRLSWITFIFLPLTFLAGFFGMNVTMLQHISIKWYFVVAVPLMVLILASWLFFRMAMSKAKRFGKGLNPDFRSKTL